NILSGLAFSILLGKNLIYVSDLLLDGQSLKIAVPSFLVPFLTGLTCGVWLLPEQSWISSLAIWLVFAITAIPVLYLYL
ncbi:sodium:proton antiporter, partial [Pseudomonas syringae pv. tagetis]